VYGGGGPARGRGQERGGVRVDDTVRVLRLP
jgi:hypothetical protein